LLAYASDIDTGTETDTAVHRCKGYATVAENIILRMPEVC